MNKTKQTYKKQNKKTIAGISVSDLNVTLILKNQLSLMPPPDETHRGVEIVVDNLVVCGRGGSRKRLW